MKSKHRKYNNGGPVKPKKRREKVYTDKGLYEKALKSYQDSLALNSYYNLQQEIEPQEPEQSKAAFDAMQELVNTGRRDTSRVNELRTLGNRIVDESDGTIQWAGNRRDGYSPDLQYYSVQDDPDKGMFSKVFDKLSTNTLSPLINKASKYWLGNAYNAVWDEPSVTPVYMNESGLKVKPKVNLTAKAQNPIKPRKIYNGEAVDPMFEEYKKESVRPKEGMVELPPKLPFPNIDLNKLPALRRVLPEIYSRKLNQQKGEYIYDTSEGQVRKRIGQEDADYVRMNRAAIDRMRQKLR